MPFTALDVLYGFAAPAVAAFLVTVALRFVLPADVGERYASSVGFAAAIELGYWLLALGPWTPDAHWHWLPYATVFAAVIGSAASAAGVRLVERIVLYAVTGLIAAWYLAPTWEDVDPSRTVQIATWTGLIAVVTALIYPLPRYLSGWIFGLVLAAVSVCGAVVLIYSDSLRFGQIAGLAVGAMAGLAGAAAASKQHSTREPAALPFVVFLCGAMWIGQTNSFSEVPLKSYLLVPLSPILLWACAVGPLARTRPAVRAGLCLVAGTALALVGVWFAASAATPVGE